MPYTAALSAEEDKHVVLLRSDNSMDCFSLSGSRCPASAADLPDGARNLPHFVCNEKKNETKLAASQRATSSMHTSSATRFENCDYCI